MSTRLHLDEMIRVIEDGDGPQAWRDLLEDIAYSHYHIVDLTVVLRTSARLLDEFFPGRDWGWQDFDQFVADHVLIHYSTHGSEGSVELDSTNFRIADLDDGSGKMLVKIPASLDAVTR